MPLITLIGEHLAGEGKRFIYFGPNNECRNCKLKTVCFNLKLGREYEIIKVRDKQHSCSLHYGNVVVVEVREMPIIAAVDQKYSEGARVRVNKIGCRNIGCGNYEICNTLAIQNEKMYTIKKVYEKMECPAGHRLNKVELSDQ
ncbi:MAG: hypothetical protein DRN08_01285 [Thermoplasmata archaeon]|nr:MAG: hypothetical protein DRN08_01285 [Thermoplasmata archaeon]